MYVYAPTPPAGVTVADPVDAALHKTGLPEAVADTAVGCVIVTLVVAVHPVATSVTMQVYEPEGTDAVAEVPPEGDHA